GASWAPRMSTGSRRAPLGTFSAEPEERSSTIATSWPATINASATLDPMKPAPPVIRIRMASSRLSDAARARGEQPAGRGPQQRPFARSQRAGRDGGREEGGTAGGGGQDQPQQLVRVAGHEARHGEQQQGRRAEA